MSRAKRAAQRRVDEDVARRRSSAANRALRRRAARGKGALATGVTPVNPRPTTADAPVTSSAQDEAVSGELEDDAHLDDVASDNDVTPDDDVVQAEPGADETAVFAPIKDQVAHAPVTDDPVIAEPVTDDAAADQTEAFDAVPETSTMPPVDPEPVAPEPAEPVQADPVRAEPAPATPVPPPPPPAAASAPEPPAEPTAPPQDDEPKPRTKRRKAWLIPFVIVFLAVLYVGAQALLSNTVPSSTETMGIAIGGMSAVQAEGEIDAHTSELKAANLELRAAEQVFELPAADAGLDIDAAATVAQVTGFTLAPDRLWAHIMGGTEIEPVALVDQKALADAVESAATHVDGPAQDAGVTVTDGAVTVVPGRSAVTVDQEASAKLISDQWPLAQSVELVAETQEPAITDDAAEAFALELESQTFAAPVTLVGDDAQATLDPATIAAHSTVVSGAAGLDLDMDGEGLTAAILADHPELTTEGDNASVSFDDDFEIVIDEGTPGITIDAERMGEAVKAAARTGDRMGELPYTAADPEVSAADLGLADYQERIVSFDTPITSDRVRTQNLRAAARDVTGTILHPGDSFDLVETLQPITEERGYGSAGVIVNGILTKGMGGGLSQMATNVYNAAYFAGWEITEHRPHSVWLPRYPAGRESTMYTGSINVVFENNTPYSAVLNSYIDGGRLYVDVWSTQHFEVDTYASEKSNVRQPGVKEVTAANCEAKSAGQPGFTITNTRTVSLDGEEVDSSSYTWTYQPDDAIRCVSPDDDDEEENDE